MPDEGASLSLVVPCYNEVDNLPYLFTQVTDLLANSTGVSVILVNNGSTDNSKAVLESYLAEKTDPRLLLVTVEKNLGYGFGILSGLAHAKSELLAWTHADLQTDLADVLTGYEVYCRQPGPGTFVKGSRKKRRFAEKFLSLGMEIYASLKLGKHLTEINAQPKLFTRQFYETYLKEGAPSDFSLDLYALFLARSFGTVLEFPVFFKDRLHGEAKGGGGKKTRMTVINRSFAYIDELARKKNQYQALNPERRP